MIDTFELYCYNETMKQIVLTQGQFTVIDDEDFDRVNQHKWYFDNGRAIKNDKMVDYKRGKRILLHRFIMGVTDGQMIDHIDQDPLNNQKINLRFTNKSENGLNRGKNKNNTSGHKGVSFNKRQKTWIGQIQINGKKIFLGYYKTKEEANEAYKHRATNLL